jgi:hypothetical protein
MHLRKEARTVVGSTAKGLNTLAGTCVLAAFCSVLVAAPAIAGPAKGKPFVALQDQIVEVEGAISSLSDQVEILIGDVDSIEARMSASETAIQDLQNQIDSLNALIIGNYTTIDDVNAAIDALSADMTAENEALKLTLQAAIADVEAGTIDLTDDLQLQIDNNKALIAILSAEIESQAEWEAFNDNLINGVCPDGSFVTSIEIDGSLVCGDVGDNGGAAGTLLSFTSFGPDVRVYPAGVPNPERYNSTSGYNFGYATCPEGSIVTSGQWVSGGARAVNLVFSQTYVHGSADAWTPKNSARIGAFNTSDRYIVSFRPAATCMRLN